MKSNLRYSRDKLFAAHALMPNDIKHIREKWRKLYTGTGKPSQCSIAFLKKMVNRGR